MNTPSFAAITKSALHPGRQAGYAMGASAYVYFIQAGRGGPIKIGYSQTVAARLKALQKTCPDKLRLIGSIPGDKVLEADIHALLDAHRLHHEWFSCHPYVRSVMYRLLAHAKCPSWPFRR